MAESNPWWLEPAIYLGGIAVTGIAGLFGFRKGREAEDEPHGAAKVVAASFVDSSQMMLLTAAIEGVSKRLDTVITHMVKNEEYRHEEALARDILDRAELKALRDRGVK